MPIPPKPNRLVVLNFTEGMTGRDIRIVNKITKATNAKILWAPRTKGKHITEAFTVGYLQDVAGVHVQHELTSWLRQSEAQGMMWDSVLVLSNVNMGFYTPIHIKPKRTGYWAKQMPDMITILTTPRTKYMKELPPDKLKAVWAGV